MTYEGGFKDNKFHGNAYEKGHQYIFEGKFLHGAREKGTLKWDAEDGEYIYEGTFNDNNKFHGNGTI